jgi:hypothetical protein
MSEPSAKRILDFWQSIDRVDPLPDSWSESAQLCMQLEKLIAIVSASNGVDYTPSEYANFMPPRWEQPPKRKSRPLTAEEEAARIDRGFHE